MTMKMLRKIWYIPVLMMMGGTLLFLYVSQPAFRMTMDVNPSVEVVTNRLERVIEVNAKNEDAAPILKALSPGSFIKVRGIANIDQFDGELTISSLTGIKKIPDFTTKRMDNSPVKRVELHAHTTMSDMDSGADCKKLLKTAKKCLT